MEKTIKVEVEQIVRVCDWCGSDAYNQTTGELGLGYNHIIINAFGGTLQERDKIQGKYDLCKSCFGRLEELRKSCTNTNADADGVEKFIVRGIDSFLYYRMSCKRSEAVSLLKNRYQSQGGYMPHEITIESESDGKIIYRIDFGEGHQVCITDYQNKTITGDFWSPESA